MKSFSELDLPDGAYPGEDVDIPNDIYNPILANTLIHKRSTFSFNSISLVELTEGLEGFIANGKNFYLLIGDVLDEHDKKRIYEGKKRIKKGLQELCLKRLNMLIENRDETPNIFLCLWL